MQLDHRKLEQFLGQVVGELGAAMNAALVLIGEKLGLYKAMAGAGPITSAELAKKTNTDERYVRANGFRRRRLGGTSPTIRRGKRSSCLTSKPSRLRWKTAPRTFPARSTS